MKLATVWLSASAMTLVMCGVATAQPAPSGEPPAEKSGDTVEKVVVTAERRSTSLQRTPISATVLTGEELENKGVTNVDQIQFISPSAAVNNFGQGIDFNIRGIGKAEHNTQTTTGVITYRDGVATFPGYFTAEPYYDIARIEILRGPQGTFVGQNATGGAIFVTSNNPVIDGGYHGYIAGQIGNYSDFGLQGAMNVPISDTVAARVAFNGETRDSFYNITGPHTGNDGLKMASGRVSLLWQPSSQFTALFKTDYNFQDFGGYPADPVLRLNDPFEITANAEHYARDKFVRSSLKLDYSFLDGTTIRSITGYQWGNSAYRTDLDGTSVGINTFADSVDETIWSQEVNIISADDASVRWIVGAFFQTDLHDFLPDAFVIHTPFPGPGDYILEGINAVQGRAVFGQLGFNLADSLEVQFGARWSDSWTKNEGFISQYGLPLLMRQSEKYDDVSGKVSLNWTVDESNFLYGFVATGFKPGGLNVDVGLGPPAPFDSEKVTSYEVGWKSGMFDGNLRTQLTAFYNNYEDFQVIIGYPAFPVFGFELNVPDTTTMYGVELQAEAVFGNFSVDSGLGWMHSEMGEFYATDPRAASFLPCNPVSGPVSVSCIALEGRDQTYAPEFTFNVGAQYVFELGEGDTLTPRLNFGHVSQQWATLFGNPARGDRIEERNIFNAQLAWTHDQWVTTLYGTNVTDEHYVGAINTGLRFAGPPRQFGLRVAKLF